MFESWAVNAFVISNILTILLVIITYFIYSAILRLPHFLSALWPIWEPASFKQP